MNNIGFSEDERNDILKEINSLFPERINFEEDGYYDTIIVLAAKNYILRYEEEYFLKYVLPKKPNAKQVIYKGSSIKATTKEPALQQFIKDIIDSILNDKRNYLEIYNNYIKEIINIKDIKRWCSKKTVTSKVMQNTRTNEVKIRDSIAGSEYKEGDKIYTFYNNKDELILAENFNNDYNKIKLLGKLYKTTKTFESIIDESIFINYSLKKHNKYLNDYGILLE